MVFDPILGAAGGQSIPIDVPRLIETRLLLQAGSGGGKSWALRRILEQTASQVQQIVIDPEGEFATLREKFDYLVCAPRDADAVANPGTASVLARRVLEAGVSAIIDIYELKAHERTLFVRRFLDSLMAAPKALWHPLMVVIDEAQLFCPQNGSAESAAAVIDLSTRGRKRGMCAILATLRLSKLHKDAAAEMLNKLIGRTGLDVDVRRAADELGFSAKEAVARLRELEPGDFFVFGPAFTRAVTEVRVGAVQTTHPKVGERLLRAPPPPTAKIRESLAKLADLQKEAVLEAQTIDEMKAENARLRREATLAKKQAQQAGAPEAEVLKRVAAAVKEAHAAAVEETRDLNAQLHLARKPDPRHLRNAQILEKIAALMSQHEGESANTQPAKPTYARPEIEVRSPQVRKPALPIAAVQRLSRIANGSGIGSGNESASIDLTNSQQRIVDALAQLEAYGIEEADRAMVAAHSGVPVTSGGFKNNLGRLRTLELIYYPAAGLCALTFHGRSLAATPKPLTLDDLHGSWLNILPDSQARLLKAALEAYPEALSREDLAELVGVPLTSGGYKNNLGRLRTLGAIEYPSAGQVRAAAILFPAH